MQRRIEALRIINAAAPPGAVRAVVFSAGFFTKFAGERYIWIT